jgi:hypothetical protein
MLTQGATTGGGFIDLVSLLLATPIPEHDPSPDAPVPSGDLVSFNNVGFCSGDTCSGSLGLAFSKDQPATDASSLGVTTSATPDQIASALIRFMAKGTRSGTLAVTPPTGTGKKGSSLPRVASNPTTATALGFPSNYFDPADFNSSNAIAVNVPQPAVVSVVVSVDPQMPAGTVSISSESSSTPELLNRSGLNRSRASASMLTGSLPSRPMISDSNSGAASNPSSTGRLSVNPTPGQPAPEPSFPNLDMTDAPAAKAPVAFRMQLTSVSSAEIPDPQTTTGPHSLVVPQGSYTSLPIPVPAQEEPAKSNMADPNPAPTPSNAISPPAVEISPAVFKDSVSNEGQDAGVAGSTSSGLKLVSGAKASAPTNPGGQGNTTTAQTGTTQSGTAQTGSAKASSAKASSDDKPGEETKAGTETDTADDAPEKAPLATAPPAASFSQIPGAAFPSLHAPAATPPAPLHAAATGSKAMEPAATPLPSSGTRDAIAEPQPPSPGQTQQIDIRITPPQAPGVDLQVSQRSGQIQVVVRTPDPGLETALRQDLGTLVHSLERSGFQAETFIPNSSESARMNSQPDPQHTHPDSSGNGAFAQGGGQNQGRNSGRGSGGNSRGNASRDPGQFEARTNPQEQQL